MNAHKTIYVVSPEYDSNGLMIFRDNLKHEIKNRNVLLLLASASTGTTVKNCIECVSYYGGILQGISLYSVPVDNCWRLPHDSLFKADDIPGNTTFTLTMIALCARQMRKWKLLLNGYGYSEL